MKTLAAISIALSATACESDGGSSEPPKQTPEVSGSRSDSSPPLREIPPATPREGKRVHPVKPLPRPTPDAGTDEKDR
jgi:hypothetical protein